MKWSGDTVIRICCQAETGQPSGGGRQQAELLAGSGQLAAGSEPGYQGGAGRKQEAGGVPIVAGVAEAG